jgi:DNA-binding MarR family transcriptional regulator
VARSPTLSFLLHDVTRMLRADFRNRAGRSQFTPLQWRVLAYLSRMEGCLQRELADVVEVRPMTIARLLDRMQQMKLIERRRDASDRRAQRVYLTPRARRAAHEMRAIGKRCSSQAVRGFTGAERRALTDLLARVRANLAGRQHGAPARTTGR